MADQWKGFVEGGAASMVAGFATHPLDLIKVRMQLQGEAAAPAPRLAFALDGRHGAAGSVAVPRPGPLGVGLNVARSEGVQALYSGVSATLLRQCLYSSTRMGLYEYLKLQWRDESSGSGLPLYKKVTAALVSGGFGAVVGNPADLAMVRMQADGRLPVHERRNYTGVGNALSRMVKQDGVTSLWTGSAPTVTRAMLVTAAQLATYDQIKDSIKESRVVPEGLATQVVASCGAGVLASVASNPIDVVKTRVMNMKVGAGEAAPYRGALDCAVKTVRAEGPLALYKGFVPTVTRQGPFAIVMFLSLEQIKKLMD
jgi:solute carrier family 25 oxoglutarate transporter 11